MIDNTSDAGHRVSFYRSFSIHRYHHWSTEKLVHEKCRELLSEFGHEAAKSVQIRRLFFLFIPTEIIDLHKNKHYKMLNAK
jgi:hypothetical protein